jgi:hypothetical protein
MIWVVLHGTSAQPNTVPQLAGMLMGDYGGSSSPIDETNSGISQ